MQKNPFMTQSKRKNFGKIVKSAFVNCGEEKDKRKNRRKCAT